MIEAEEGLELTNNQIWFSTTLTKSFNSGSSAIATKSLELQVKGVRFTSGALCEMCEKFLLCCSYLSKKY